MKKLKCKSVFISDVHLGFRGCQARFLSKFLKTTQADNYFLLGDILDIWSFKETHFWNESHTEVLKILLKKAKNSHVVLIPGNHDHELRRIANISFGNISIINEMIYESISGKRFLLTHGDLYDSVIQQHKWIVNIGCYLYDKLIIISHYISELRRLAGRVHWSLSAYLKHKVKAASCYIGDFRSVLVDECHKRGVDGAICGHIHSPSIETLDDVTYMNCGDWVETLSVVIEHHDGTFSLYKLKDGIELFEIATYEN